MSVIVKGMEMPKNCTRCDYIGLNAAIGCSVMSGTNGRATDCPLVALPDTHGRLVDADALIEFVEDRYDITWESDNYEGGIKDACTDILEKIDTMPTIVEAEDRE